MNIRTMTRKKQQQIITMEQKSNISLILTNCSTRQNRKLGAIFSEKKKRDVAVTTWAVQFNTCGFFCFHGNQALTNGNDYIEALKALNTLPYKSEVNTELH